MWLLWHMITPSRHHVTTVAHDNTVLRHFVANTVFLSSSDCQGKKILERKTSFNDRYSGAILLALKLFTVSCQALKHNLTIHKTPDSLLVIWLQSCTVQSPASIAQLSWSLLFPCITSLTQCNLIGPSTFWHVEQEWDRPLTRPFSLYNYVAQNGLGLGPPSCPLEGASQDLV